jgi:hypothetical protein
VSENQPSLNEGQTIRKVTINYIKSNFHRLIRIDAVRGGITPDGEIYIELCSERPTMPQQVVLTLDQDGEVQGKSESPPINLPTFDREVEVSAVMSSETALSLADWLIEIVGMAEGDEEDEDYYEEKDDT